MPKTKSPAPLAPTKHIGPYDNFGVRRGGGGSPPPSLWGRVPARASPRASVALASCLLGGGGCGHPRWLRCRPRLHCPPPPLQPWARPAAGVGGKDGGARALWTFLAPSRPRSLMRRGRMGHRATHLHSGIASSKGLQGGFGLGRVQVPPHPSAIRGSRMLQGRIWGSRVLQDILWCRHRGSERLLLCVRGVRDRARVSDRVVPLPLRRGAAPPTPSVGGQDRHRSAAMRHWGGRAARGADRQRRPSQHRGAAARLPTRGGGGGGS